MKENRVRFFSYLVIVIALLTVTLTSCGAVATKIKDIPNITQNYFEGDSTASTYLIDLNEYVNANGSKVEYEVVLNEQVAVAGINADTLSLEMKDAGTCNVTVTVKSNGKPAFTLPFVLTSTPGDNRVPVATKIKDIADVTKGYFAGNSENSTVKINLDKYVDANGGSLIFESTAADEGIVKAEIDGRTLTLEMLKRGRTDVCVKVVSNGKHAFNLEFGVQANTNLNILCVGDSLTYGNSDKSTAYPVFLQNMLSNATTANVNVYNFGKNGASMAVSGTRYSDITYLYDNIASLRITTVVLMLGTNDATHWEKAKDTYERQTYEMIEHYRTVFPNCHIVLMVSPPTLDGNGSGIPNDVIRACVNPIQRKIIGETGLPSIDLRELFESYMNDTDGENTKEYRELFTDGVHFSVKAAKLVAQKVSELIYTL